ncbi:MAG: FCD domain-containing protein [Desulfosarcinaceae bacterium]|jgi:GntR family transcriptional repressor for pyruvate dehydrogenase complex
MKFDAVRLTSAPGALTEAVIKQIKAGELAPGDCLPSQRELARQFQVGLGTVREAIKTLDAMGYLEVIRGKGTFVAATALETANVTSKIDKTLEAVSLADLIKAREIVECGAARLAAELRDADSLARLQAITAQMETSPHDTDLYYQLDFDFHLEVAKASGNQALYELAKLLVDRAHGHMNFMSESLRIAMPFNVEKAVLTAREVVAHIAACDAERAAASMYTHLNIVNLELTKQFFAKAKSRAKAPANKAS